MHINNNNSMINKKTFTIALLMGFCLLLSTSEAQSNQDCCLSYTKAHLPRWAITGFVEQSSSEVCDIDAIIFHTKRGLKACANPKDHWVKSRLQWLSEKLKKLSQ